MSTLIWAKCETLNYEWVPNDSWFEKSVLPDLVLLDISRVFGWQFVGKIFIWCNFISSRIPGVFE